VPGDAPITPLSIPAKVRTLIVYGGSFDPPHFYHTIGPLSIVGRLFGPQGWVLYVPAARSPHKPDGPHAGDEHRLAMLRLALDVPGPRSIWTDELDRARWRRERGLGTPSYTIDTLRRLRRIIPSRVSLRLLIGSDQVGAFHRWKDPREIIRLAEPIVMVREPVVSACSVYSALDKDFWSRDELRAWCTRLAPNFPMDPSSTSVRDAIPKAPKDPDRWEDRPPLNEIVTPVARYIIEHNLYGFRAGHVKAATPVDRPSGDQPDAMKKLELAAGLTLIQVGQKMLSDAAASKPPKTKPRKKHPRAKARGRRKSSS